MSPSLDIPQAGLRLESNPPSNKSATNVTPAIGLTLSNAMIEDMIKCYQNNKPIELSLGGHPNLIYGNKSHILSTYHDPFQYEVFQTANSNDTDSDNSNMSKSQVLSELTIANKKLLGPGAQPRYKAGNLKTSKKPASTNTGEDTALETLRESMATAQAKKDGNTTKIINQIPGKRGASKVTSKSKFLGKGLGNDATKSMPVSPALSGLGSPALGATKSLSQQQAENAKSSRKPVVHLLALEPMSEKELNNRIPGPKDDLKQAIAKVGDLNTSTGKWELRKNYYKELDVFSFKYGSDAERQRAIDNAVKIFDKMRLGLSEPEWEKLLPKSERGTGKSLSKVQASITNGAAAKLKSNDEEDVFGDKMTSKVKAEATTRSASGPPATKPKKLSEKEAQAKRLLSKNPPKTAAATMKSKAVKKEAEKPKASAAKPLSSQYVVESDDEEVPIKKPQVTKAPVKKENANSKRGRNEEMDSSDSSLPLSKKIKKETANSHRVSDASQSSRPSSNSTTSSSNSFKGKANSPQKSSPLASSPPTNASDFGHTSSGSRSSTSTSPANHHTLSSTRNNRSPIHKRHQKSSSVASSVSSTDSTRRLRPGVLDLAENYKRFYPIYLKLHNELATSKVKNPSEEEKLLAMHERLSDLKKQILEGIIEE
ncbi:hypothetical protein BCIN_05g04680 [Botrytis cinerea B05.10]|uniref:RNA polymerase II elongation factor ELL N-terminal domain-containing protein n=1 Tax=Botryotinia fuckeliana (strain B05.10) TaxID=332648 RepID=A0A384JHQ7_BOTFB|nr:hypothetical protein BCIN_05g04680 [Botrytis cinerea B05.10]ATZ50080.1 hypothetical protein BCIN_05g04680 [Botrytis cinerea B05.10]